MQLFDGLVSRDMSLKKYLRKIYDNNSNIDCELVAYALDNKLYMTRYMKNKHLMVLDYTTLGYLSPSM